MKLRKAISKTGLLVKKHSPEILVVSGVACIIGGTILCCKGTTKAQKLLELKKQELDSIHEAREEFDEEKYSDKEYKKDLTINKVQKVGGVIGAYLPGAALTGLGIVCILCANNILRKRYVAAMGLYTTVQNSFDSYRSRVREEYGEEVDRDFNLGLKTEKVKTKKDGKTVTEEVKVQAYDQPSVYARYFDKDSLQWNSNPEYNLMFLKSQQNYANDLLKAQGHVFLNEVYDMLGLPRSQAGAVCGWVEGEGDNFIDFGIFKEDNPSSRAFVNGKSDSILLDFNVDGCIYDLI